MTIKTRTLNDEQTTTAINICKEQGLSIDYVDAVRVIYSAMSRATGRVASNKSYKDRGILFTIADSPKQATINVIQQRPDLFDKVKRLYDEYVASGFRKKFRIELDRIDNSGHYSLDNINFLTQFDHAKKSKLEKCIPVNLFALVHNGYSSQIETFNSKYEAKKSLKVNDETLNKMMNNNCIYRNANGDVMTLLQVEFLDTVPPDVTIKGAKSMDEYMQNNYKYLQTLNNLYDVKPTEKLAKQINDFSEAIARCELKLQPDNITNAKL